MPIPLPGRTDSTLYWLVVRKNKSLLFCFTKRCHAGSHEYGQCVLYLLYVSDVHQLDNFILLGRTGSGTGALKAQVAGGNRENSQKRF